MLVIRIVITPTGFAIYRIIEAYLKVILKEGKVEYKRRLIRLIENAVSDICSAGCEWSGNGDNGRSHFCEVLNSEKSELRKLSGSKD